MANYKKTESQVAASGLFGGPGKGIIKNISANAAERGRKREARKTARHQSKIMTTTYNKPDKEQFTETAPGYAEAKGTMTIDQISSIPQTNINTGEITLVNREDTNLPEAKVTSTPMEITKDVEATTTTTGDVSKYGTQSFDVAKIYKGIGDEYDVRKKASMTKTKPADESFGFGVTKNTGTQLNIKKYTKGGVIKRDKTFEIKGSGWRDEGGVGDTRVSEEKEKGVKYISEKRMDRISSRFKKKWNQRSGYGSSNLAQGGAGVGAGQERSEEVSGVNLTDEERKQKAASDKNRQNTYAKKSKEAKKTGTTGTKSRYVERRHRKQIRRNK